MNILELCKCAGTNICPFCMILTAVCLLAIGVLLGYFIGKKKSKQ
jgi:hypothetical protein